MIRKKPAKKQINQSDTHQSTNQDEQTTTIEQCCILWWILSDKKYIFSDHGIKTTNLFLKSLPKESVMESMQIAFTKKLNGNETTIDSRFSYYCGICWNKIKTENYKIQSGCVGYRTVCDDS